MAGKKSRRGRRPYKPTAKQRASVMNLKATRSTDDEIALAIGIDANTLRKHFRLELDTANVRRREEWVGWLVSSARPKNGKTGNVTAQKALVAMVLSGTGSPSGSQDSTESTKPAKLPTLGKKAAAQEVARTAGIGSDWGNDLVPGAAKTN